MSIGSFIKKQFIDVIQWNEDSDGTLAWRYPMEDFEIQYGASLTVRDSQMAVFVNEGKIADVFGPGRYTLTTQTIPVLTYLKNWDKAFESPFKSDEYFFSARLQHGRNPPQPAHAVFHLIVPGRAATDADAVFKPSGAAGNRPWNHENLLGLGQMKQLHAVDVGRQLHP